MAKGHYSLRRGVGCAWKGVHECDCAQERGGLKEVEVLSYVVSYGMGQEDEISEICQVFPG